MTELGSTQYQGPAQKIQEVEKSEDSEYSEDYQRIARKDHEGIDTINHDYDPQEVLDDLTLQEIAEGAASEYDIVAAPGNPLIAVSKGEAGFGYNGEEDYIEGQVLRIDENVSGCSDGRTGKVSPGKLEGIAEDALTGDNGEELPDGVQTALTPDGPGMVDGETGDRLPGNRSKKYSGQWEEIEDDAEII